MPELTETETAVLDFAGRTYRYQGTREADILTEFEWSLPRHSQVLDALLDRPEALAYDPLIVRRLIRLRDRRRRGRTQRP